jgi:flagellar basal-body rod protein FlgG
VLDENGQHINLPQQAVGVSVDGAIIDNGNEIARLAIVDYTPNQLQRAGEAYFTATGDGQPPVGSPGLRQGFLEGSNSNLVEEMTSLLAVQRTYQANQAVLAKLDGTLDQAAGELGRL